MNCQAFEHVPHLQVTTGQSKRGRGLHALGSTQRNRSLDHQNFPRPWFQDTPGVQKNRGSSVELPKLKVNHPSALPYFWKA